MDNEGYYALYISILANVTPDQAFEMYFSGKKPRMKFDKEDEELILSLKQKGYTNRAIGQLFGINEFTLAKRVHKLAKVYGVAI